MLRPVLAFAILAAIAGEPLYADGPTDLVNRRITAQVLRVADGDTVEVLVAPGRQVRVRLHGVDTPERNEPFSTRARTFTRVMMFGRTVTVVGKDVDRYGRLVARVVVDEADASEAIIAAGLGCTFRRYGTDARLEAALVRARAARAGFWAADAPRPACVAREARTDTRGR